MRGRRQGVAALRRQPFAWAWLTVAWVLLWGELSVGNVLAGLALSAVLLTVLPMPAVSVGVGVRPVAALVLVLRFLLDVVVASAQVAWLAVRPGSVPRASVVTIPLRSRNELVQTLVAEMMSLVPGSLAVDLDVASGRLSLHVLALETPEQAEAFRRRVLEQERRLLAAFGTTVEERVEVDP